MRTLIKALAVFLMMFGVVAAAPVVHAAETTAAEQPGTMDKCEDGQYDIAATKQLISEGKVSKDGADKQTNTLFLADETIARAKEENPERFQELVDGYKNDKSGSGKAGRATNTLTCGVQYPVLKAGEALDGFWKDPIGKFTKAVMEGNAETLQTMMTFWMDFSTQSVDTSANIAGVKNIVMGLSGFALVASFIMGGYRLASGRRGGLQTGLEDMSDNMVRWILFSLAVPAMVPGMLIASDLLAKEIMDQFGATSPDAFVSLVAMDDKTGGPVLLLMLAGVSLAGSVVQIIALVGRVLVLPIAAGLTPLFAALSFTETGRNGLNHLVAYIIAGIIFKPVSALLYVVVLWNAQSGDGSLTSIVLVSVMIGLAGFSGPALVRAIVPAVAQAGGGGAAPMLAGAAGAAGALGAVMGGAGGMVKGMAGTAARGASSSAGSGASAAAGSGSVLSAGGSGPGAGGGGGSIGGGRAGGGGGGAGAPSGAGIASGGSVGGGRGNVGAAGGAAQPVGASASRRGNISAAGRNAAGALARGGRAGVRGAGAITQGAGRGLNTGGSLAGAAAHGSQRILDESIGVPGHYAGQVQR